MLHDSHLELLYLFFKARELQICTEFRDVVAFILGFIYIYNEGCSNEDSLRVEI